MIRIAQVIDSLGIGGAEALQVVFAKAVKSHNVELIVVGLDHRVDLKDEIEAQGARVYNLPGKNLPDPRRILKLVQLIRQQDIDIIHTHLNDANILGNLAGMICRVPVVSSLHNISMLAPDVRQFRLPLETLMLQNAREIIAVGSEVARTHQPRWPNKPVAVITNAVAEIAEISTQEKQTIRREILGEQLGRPLVLSVGRLAPQKAYSDLLLAWAQLIESFPGAFLAIAGRGELHEELESQIESLGLAQHARLLGVRSDIPRLLRASDMFVISSHWEGLPVAMLEAMSAGLPIVSTAVGDIPQVLVEGMGVLVPPKRPDLLAKAVGSLLANQEQAQQLGRQVYRRMQSEYHADVWAEKLLHIYQRAVQR